MTGKNHSETIHLPQYDPKKPYNSTYYPTNFCKMSILKNKVQTYFNCFDYQYKTQFRLFTRLQLI